MKPHGYLLVALAASLLVTFIQPVAISLGQGDWDDEVLSSSLVGSRDVADSSGRVFVGPPEEGEDIRSLCPDSDPERSGEQQETQCRESFATAQLARLIDASHFKDTSESVQRYFFFESQRPPLVTTIDLELQLVAETVLQGRSGAIVAMEPSTGNILALATTMATDDDGELPAHPAGSIFKLVIYAAGLDQDVGSVDEVFPTEVEFQRVQNFDGRSCGGDLISVIAQSCNTSAVRVMNRLYVDEFVALADDLQVNGEREHRLVEASALGPDFEANLALTSIGQFNVRLNPITAASLAATIGNGGVRVRPDFVENVDAERSVAMSSATADALTAGMVRAATSGTASAAAAGFDSAMKTGTAETGIEFDSAWTIGFAPAEDPVIAVAVLLVGSESAPDLSGGRDAAPLAVEIMSDFVGTGT